MISNRRTTLSQKLDFNNAFLRDLDERDIALSAEDKYQVQKTRESGYEVKTHPDCARLLFYFDKTARNGRGLIIGVYALGEDRLDLDQVQYMTMMRMLVDVFPGAKWWRWTRNGKLVTRCFGGLF